MARITIEDCLNQVNNRFALIHMAAKRVRLLRKGSEPTIASKNKDIVVALREIASGKVRKGQKSELQSIEAGEKPELLPETTAEGDQNKPPEEGGPTESRG
jgi:DNA-directed RNA polymerase subunit omega